MAGFSAAVADDYKVFDCPEEIVFTAVRESGPRTFRVQYATAHDYSFAEVARARDLLTVGDRQWQLGCNQFPEGVQPQIGDLIEQTTGERWRLKSNATRDALGISWIVQTAQER